MKATLMGTGDATGMPAPMCDCKYCTGSKTRLRPSVLIEHNDTTIVLDCSPDIHRQLNRTQTTSVDAFFITHSHFDHYWGVQELIHVGCIPHRKSQKGYKNSTVPKNLNFYGNRGILMETKERFDFVLDRIDFTVFEQEDSWENGELVVETFPVVHGPDDIQTCGFAVSTLSSKLVYAPDLKHFGSDSDVYKNADVLIIDGAAIGAEVHATNEEAKSAIENANADNVVLVNISEHLEEMCGSDIEKLAFENGFMVVDDFTSFRF